MSRSRGRILDQVSQAEKTSLPASSGLIASILHGQIDVSGEPISYTAIACMSMRRRQSRSSPPRARSRIEYRLTRRAAAGPSTTVLDGVTWWPLQTHSAAIHSALRRPPQASRPGKAGSCPPSSVRLRLIRGHNAHRAHGLPRWTWPELLDPPLIAPRPRPIGAPSRPEQRRHRGFLSSPVRPSRGGRPPVFLATEISAVPSSRVPATPTARKLGYTRSSSWARAGHSPWPISFIQTSPLRLPPPSTSSAPPLRSREHGHGLDLLLHHALLARGCDSMAAALAVASRRWSLWATIAALHGRFVAYASAGRVSRGVDHAPASHLSHRRRAHRRFLASHRRWAGPCSAPPPSRTARRHQLGAGAGAPILATRLTDPPFWLDGPTASSAPWPPS